MKQITYEIIKKLNRDYTELIKKKHGKSPEILLGDFILTIISWNRAKDSIKDLNISEQTFNRLIKKVFPNTSLAGGNQTWATYILSLAEYKRCFKCGTVKPLDEFYVSDSINHCKACHAVKNKKYYAERKDIRDANKSDYIARNAQRRAITKQATPSWADQEKIKEIYKNCPKGYHVDHIIPLRGTHVCGLHVEYNLQYLSEQDNLQKSNKY